MRNFIYYIINCILIRNLKGICFLDKGQYDLACQWYKTDAKYFCAGYRVDLNKSILEIPKDGEFINILIGNSATITNCHCDVLERLRFLSKIDNIRIYCPLSYGDTEYRDKLIKYAKEIYGEKFIPIINFLDYESYMKLLRKIDIGIFNLTRQQALGNLFMLFYLGAKIYMSDDITPWKMFNDLGLKLFSYQEMCDECFFEKLDEKDILNNRRIAESYCSIEQFSSNWSSVLRDE